MLHSCVVSVCFHVRSSNPRVPRTRPVSASNRRPLPLQSLGGSTPPDRSRHTRPPEHSSGASQAHNDIVRSMIHIEEEEEEVFAEAAQEIGRHDSCRCWNRLPVD